MTGSEYTRVQVCRHCSAAIVFNPCIGMWVSCAKPRSLTCDDNSIHEMDTERAARNMLYVIHRTAWQDIA